MKNPWMKRLLSGTLAAAMASTVLVGIPSQAAEEAGIPYDEQGNYNVQIPHVMVNQVYGGSDDGYASHSFIELYNPCDTAVDLNGWELQYQSSPDGEEDGWQELTLTGTIPAGGYYLVRCGVTTDAESGAYQVPEGDQEWDVVLHNKGVSVALFSEDVTLTDDFSGPINEGNRPEGYVDLLAVQGNDGEDGQMPVAYEGSVQAEQSKKKAVRRDNFTDTDDNSADVEIINYENPVDDAKGPHNSSYNTAPGGDEGNQGGQGGQDDPLPPTTDPETFYDSSFETDAALLLDRLGSVNTGQANADGGVAEIVAYNSDTGEAYVVNGQDGLLYRLEVSDQGISILGSMDVKGLVEGFTYGDMTSVAVDTVNNHIAVALQSEDYAADGRVLLLDYNFDPIACYETGVQPDMVTFTHNGRKILTADEGEPRDGYGEGAVDPAGSVTMIDLENDTVKTMGFEDFDAASLAAEGVLIGKVNGQMNTAAADLEPEYIAVSADDETAYVTLQEANAVATVDLVSGKVVSVKSLGFQDLSQAINAIDLLEDGTYEAKTYEDAVGVYMPDGISAYEANGVTYLVTANEGDAREWGEYSNEAKEDLTATDGTKAEKVRVLDKEMVTVPDESLEYLYGSRSFTVFRADTMEKVYDSANDFEEKTAQYLPAWFNCSNDNVDIDDRSRKKGPEPESVSVGQIGNRTYAFIALERVGGIMVYDITDPANASYVNYINTRDFSADIAEDVAPEGLAFISANDTKSGRPMLLAAFEVSGTVAAYNISGSATDVATPEGPSYEPLPDDGQGTEPTDPSLTPGQNPGAGTNNPTGGSAGGANGNQQPGQASGGQQQTSGGAAAGTGAGTANPTASTVSPKTSDPFGGMLFLMLVMALTGGAGLLSVLGGRKEEQ